MNHIDLFSGIGGFALAAKQVWGDDYHNLLFCEIDKYCQAVIKKNFGQESLIYDDIKTLNKEQFIKDTVSRRCLHGKTEKETTKVRQQRQSSTGDGDRIRPEKTSSDTKKSGQLRTAQPQDDGEDSKRGRRHDPANTVGNPEDVAYAKGIKNDERERGKLEEETSGRKGINSPSRSCHSDVFPQEIQDLKINLLTAGPPCQPASQAGKRKGKEDDRWLWDEMFKVIQEFKPTWCIIENVYGLISLDRGVVFNSLLSHLEGIGYEVQPFVIGAVGKNAPHKRFRVWIIAHAKSNGSVGESGGICQQEQRQVDELLSQLDNANQRDVTYSRNSPNRTEQREISKKSGIQSISREAMGAGVSTGTTVDDSDPDRHGLQESRAEQQTNGRGQSDEDDSDPKHEGHVGRGSSGRDNGDGIQEGEQAGQISRGATSRCGEEHADVGNSKGAGQSSGSYGQGTEQYGGASESSFEGWDEGWYSIALRTCVRGVVNGLSSKLDGLKLTASKHREERLRALGNAVVPPLVVEFLKTIKKVEEMNLKDEPKEQKMIEDINIDESGDRYFVTKTLKNFGVKK